MRRPVFGRHGRWVVAGLCGYELVGLVTSLPTLSELVRRRRMFGLLLLALLSHHWFVEGAPAPNPR